jgi:hypothetical protein
MRWSIHAGRFATVLTLATMVATVGCQAGDTGEVRSREQRASTTGEALARASEVTVTYYYLPG